jgi:hypothetical protein
MAEKHPRLLRVLLIALAATVALLAAWWWLGSASSTGGSTGWTAYAPSSAAPAVTDLEVSPSAPRRHDRVAVGFTSRRATGVFGKQRRSYVVQAHSVRPASACVNNRDRALPPRPAGYRLRTRLDPARGDGGELGWCRGRFTGTVRYSIGYACPASGTCQSPKSFRRRSSVTARFSFVVR